MISQEHLGRLPPRLPTPASRWRDSAGRRTGVPLPRRWPPSLTALSRRRLVVRVAKWVLPLLGMGLLLAIAVWPELEGMEERTRVAFRRVVQSSPEAIQLLEPRYRGIDDLNRPFTITAALAARGDSDEVIDLVSPRADIVLADGSWVLLEAQRGRFDKMQDHLDLSGEVRLWHDGGYLLVTEQAAIRPRQGVAWGERPVTAQGPFGILTSEGFHLLERGMVVRFTGRVRALLEEGQ